MTTTFKETVHGFRAMWLRAAAGKNLRIPDFALMGPAMYDEFIRCAAEVEAQGVKVEKKDGHHVFMGSVVLKCSDLAPEKVIFLKKIHEEN